MREMIYKFRSKFDLSFNICFVFQDLKVLELASVLAGPSVGQFFAELGAEVVKIENTTTGGDVTRSWKTGGENSDDRSAYFCAVNWGKKSVALDLRAPEDLAVVHKLVAQSDIVIASYKPGDADKLGVDYKTLSQLNPKIIYGQITGYSGEDSRVGYDAIVQAEAGFMFMNGETGGASLKMPVALIDVLAGHQLKQGILLAFINLTRNGKGQFVSVSLFDTAVASLVNQGTNYLMSGIVPQKQGSAHPNIAPYGDVFRTLDGFEVMIAVGNDKQFRALCHLLKLDSLPDHTDFSTNQVRVINRKALKTKLQQAFDTTLAQPLLELLHTHHIPAGVIQNLHQVFSSSSTHNLIHRSGALAGLKTYVGQAQVTAEGSLLLPPPHFGEHTLEVLKGLKTH